GLYVLLGSGELGPNPRGYGFQVRLWRTWEAFGRHGAVLQAGYHLFPDFGMVGDGGGGAELFQVEVGGLQSGVMAAVTALGKKWLDGFRVCVWSGGDGGRQEGEQERYRCAHLWS